MDLLQHIVGSRIVAVCADLGTLHPFRRRAAGVSTFNSGAADGELVEVTTEDFGSIALRFDNGVRGAFVLSQVSAGHKNRLQFTVDAGTASFAWDQEEPNRLWIGHREQANRELLRDPALLGGKGGALTRYPGGHQEGWPDALRGLCEDVYGAIEARRLGEPHDSSFATFEDGHQIVQLVEAVTASQASRGWVELEHVEELSI
jgi:predicted dehydrogenase